MTLGGSDTYSGGTVVSGGTLYVNGSLVSPATVSSGAALGGRGSAGAVSVNPGGLLQGGQNNSGSLTIASLSFGGSANLYGALGGSNTSAAPIIVSGAVTTGGPNTVTINLTGSAPSGPGIYHYLKYGSLAGGGFSAFALPALSNYALANDAGYVDIVYNPLLWTGTNSSAFTGGANWKLASGGVTDFASGDNVILNDTAPGTTAVNVNASVNPTSVTFNNSLLHYTLSGTGAITNGTLTKSGSGGLLTIANTNSYAGGTYVNGGTIALGANNALPVGGALSIGGSGGAPSGSGVFDLAGYSQQIGSLAVGAGATAANQIITASTGSSTLLFSDGTGLSVFAGTIRDAALGGGTLGLSLGSGTLDISSGSTTYHGATTVFGGMLVAGSLANTSAILVASGGTLSFPAANASVNSAILSNSGLVAFTAASGTVSLAAISSGMTTFAAGANVTSASGGGAALNGAAASISSLGNTVVSLGSLTPLNIAAGSQTTGAIGGGGSVIKTGSGALALAGNNTYSGGTTLSAGALDINGNNAVGTGALLIAGGSLGNTSGKAVVLGNIPQTWNSGFSYAGNNLLNLGTGPVTMNVPMTINVQNSAGTLEIDGNISSGTSELLTAGPGTVVLAGSDTISVNGATNVASLAGNVLSTGTLNLSGGNFLVEPGATFTVAGGLVNASAAADGVGTVIGNLAGGTGNMVVSGGTFQQVSALLYVGQHSNGVLTIQGSGVVALGTSPLAFSYNGGLPGTLQLNGGTLQCSGFSTTTAVQTLNFNGGILELNASSANLCGTTPGDFTANVGNGGMLVDLNGYNTTISNALTGNGGLTVLSSAGGGTLTLSGTDSHLGGTTVVDGTLVLTNNEAIADGSNLTVGNVDKFAPVVPSPGAPGASPAPEPGTLALLVASAALMGMYRRRRCRVYRDGTGIGG